MLRNFLKPPQFIHAYIFVGFDCFSLVINCAVVSMCHHWESSSGSSCCFVLLLLLFFKLSLLHVLCQEEVKFFNLSVCIIHPAYQDKWSHIKDSFRGSWGSSERTALVSGDRCDCYCKLYLIKRNWRKYL